MVFCLRNFQMQKVFLYTMRIALARLPLPILLRTFAQAICQYQGQFLHSVAMYTASLSINLNTKCHLKLSTQSSSLSFCKTLNANSISTFRQFSTERCKNYMITGKVNFLTSYFISKGIRFIISLVTSCY